jgi:long-chain acyl-CoA synthetase
MYSIVEALRLRLDVGTVEIDLADATSYKKFPIPSPTVLFIKPKHLESTVAAIAKQASKSWILWPLARRHKLAGLKEGFLTKDSLWDRLVLDGARADVIGDGAGTVRGAIIAGGMLTLLHPF